MTTYEDVPHLLTRVVTDPKRAKDALDWVVAEMERRYDLLARYGFRNLDRFNEVAAAGGLRDLPVMDDDPEQLVAERLGEETAGEEPLPYILCVIDELADLMMVAPRDIETAIVRIAQMARAVGIHLIIATQRPSVNVVTGLIKANVPSRIALSMATGHDSKTILDQHGAEKLVGQGDMLYLPANASKPHRLQGCYIDEIEIEQVVEHCKAQAEVTYAENVVKEGQEAAVADVQGDDATDADLTRAAMELVVRSGLGSTSMLQRKLKVGFARAGRLMDELEEMGVVGPSEGPKARTVLMTVDELESRGGA
jgi:S-DNA-T family DNA segregation ATPase FtsK/SpoIIIE